MSTQNTKIFSERLIAAREKRGMSQSELAEKTGFQASALSHFESGRRMPSFDSLKRLADALNVSTDYLLGRDVSEPAGPAAAKLFRHAGTMKQEDLEMLANFAEQLAQKNRRENKDDGHGKKP